VTYYYSNRNSYTSDKLESSNVIDLELVANGELGWLSLAYFRVEACEYLKFFSPTAIKPFNPSYSSAPSQVNLKMTLTTFLDQSLRFAF
jgi:hypothetical protein